MRRVPKSIVVNGKRIPLVPEGESKGGHVKLRAASGIPGLGRLFIVVYLEDEENPQAHRATPRPTPESTSPGPSMELSERMLGVLEGFSTRLAALENSLGVINRHRAVEKLPVPAPSA